MIKLLTYDVETTGLIAGSHQIHQLAYILEIDGVEVESGNLKMRPTEGTPRHAESFRDVRDYD